MAGEEDVELRDLVAQTLEAKGVLGKIRVGPLSYLDRIGPFRVQYRVLYPSERGDSSFMFEEGHDINRMIFSFIPGSASCQCISSFGGARIPTGKYSQIDV